LVLEVVYAESIYKNSFAYINHSYNKVSETTTKL